MYYICSYICKAIIKATSLETQEVLSLKIKEQLNDTYEEGPLSLHVKPEGVAVKPIGNISLKPHWESNILQFWLQVVYQM